MIVVIDGPAGSGKSSTAKAIANDLRIQYLDSGALYRSVTLLYLQSDKNRAKLFESLKENEISFHFKNDFFHVFINGKDVSDEIREMHVSKHVSEVAAMADVRSYVNALMNEHVKHGIYIADGRDLGTAVFPDAAKKFFLVADLETRAKRRLIELTKASKEASLEEVKQNLAERDATDSSRTADPLKKADDAIELDTGSFTFEEQVEHIKGLIEPIISSATKH